MSINFKRAAETASRSGPEAALAAMADELAAAGKPHELFEVRLIQARRRLGLPALLPGGWDQLPPNQRDQLEEDYLAACRETAETLIAAGRLREAWPYVRPTGDFDEFAAALRAAPIDPEQLAETIELALHEGVAPLFGFELVLEHYGVCNAVTAYDAGMRGRDAAIEAAAAELLVRRLHADVEANVRADVETREGKPPSGEASLQQLIADRAELFAEGAYHIDVSHLASIVRFARAVTDRDMIDLADQLCAYGLRLDERFQYAADEPFSEFYLGHRLFFGAQRGRDVETAVDYFRDRADRFTPREFGPEPAEVYVTLLGRLGRCEEAMREADHRWHAAGGGFDVRLLWSLAESGGRYDLLRELAELRGDVAAFAAAIASDAK